MCISVKQLDTKQNKYIFFKKKKKRKLICFLKVSCLVIGHMTSSRRSLVSHLTGSIATVRGRGDTEHTFRPGPPTPPSPIRSDRSLWSSHFRYEVPSPSDPSAKITFPGWSWSSTGRELAEHAQSPGFHAQHHTDQLCWCTPVIPET